MVVAVAVVAAKVQSGLWISGYDEAAFQNLELCISLALKSCPTPEQNQSDVLKEHRGRLVQSLHALKKMAEGRGRSDGSGAHSDIKNEKPRTAVGASPGPVAELTVSETSSAAGPGTGGAGAHQMIDYACKLPD